MDVEGRSAPPGNSSLKNGCGPGPPWSGPAAVSADYSWLLDAIKAEGSALTIYSNTDKENRAPILRDFKAKYPWTKAPADMLVSVMAYDSPETEQLPEFARGNPDAWSGLDEIPPRPALENRYCSSSQGCGFLSPGGEGCDPWGRW